MEICYIAIKTNTMAFLSLIPYKYAHVHLIGGTLVAKESGLCSSWLSSPCGIGKYTKRGGNGGQGTIDSILHI